MIFFNAKDAIISRNIKNPKIKIEINIKNNLSITSILDNAGIGLYMSKMIIESHFKGNILVTNKQNGVAFSIEV